MAHRRKPLAAALVLNSAVLVAEIGGGLIASSLSLVMMEFTTFLMRRH